MKDLISIKSAIEALKSLNVLDKHQIKHINRFISMSIVFIAGVLIAFVAFIVYVDGKNLINSYRKQYFFHNKYLFSVYLEPVLIRVFIGLLRIASGLSLCLVYIGLSHGIFILKDLFFAVFICTTTFLLTKYTRVVLMLNK